MFKKKFLWVPSSKLSLPRVSRVLCLHINPEYSITLTPDFFPVWGMWIREGSRENEFIVSSTTDTTCRQIRGWESLLDNENDWNHCRVEVPWDYNHGNDMEYYYYNRSWTYPWSWNDSRVIYNSVNCVSGVKFKIVNKIINKYNKERNTNNNRGEMLTPNSVSPLYGYRCESLYPSVVHSGPTNRGPRHESRWFNLTGLGWSEVRERLGRFLFGDTGLRFKVSPLFVRSNSSPKVGIKVIGARPAVQIIIRHDVGGVFTRTVSPGRISVISTYVCRA